MKSRHLLALATGTCLGLAGLGQVAFADRGDHDRDKDRDKPSACAAKQHNSSDNEISDSENESGLLSLIDLNNLALQGNNISLLANVLCNVDILNDVNLAVLGDVEDGDGGHGDGDGKTTCKAKQKNDSDNEISESENDGVLGLVGLNNVALQGENVSVLGNVACDVDVANDVNVAVLGDVEDEDEGKGKGKHKDGDDAGTSCKAEQHNRSENGIYDSENETGLLSLLGLNNLALQGNNISAVGNLACHVRILNDVNIAVLGDILGRS